MKVFYSEENERFYFGLNKRHVTEATIINVTFAYSRLSFLYFLYRNTTILKALGKTPFVKEDTFIISTTLSER